MYLEEDNVKRRLWKGRFPIHDNECMITGSFSNLWKKKTGDSITLRVGKIEADYIICGLVISTVNNGGNVYLNEGVNVDGFKKKLFGLYGTPNMETEKTVVTGTLTERIQAEVERKIGVLLAMFR